MFLETSILDQEGFLLPDGRLTSLEAVSPVLRETPILQFYPGDTLCGDFTNYWVPNLRCLHAMLEDSGFAVQKQTILGPRALLECVAAPESRKSHQNRAARGLTGH